MFSIIYCFLPLLFIPFNLFLDKRRESISWEVKRGKKCYSCKEDLDLPEEDLFKRILSDKEHTQLCVPCSRDMKLSLIKNTMISLKFKFHKYLFSNKSNNTVYYFTIAVFLFILLDIILMTFGIKIKLYLIYGSINILFWAFNTYKTLYTTIKKPQK